MKKFKHLWLAGLLLAATVGFTSCDDDDDNATSAKPGRKKFVTKEQKSTTQPFCYVLSEVLSKEIYQDLRSDVGRFRKRHFLMQTSIWLLHLTPV